MNLKSLLTVVILFIFFTAPGICQNTQPVKNAAIKGHLFIIGGGEKTEGLMKELLKVSGIGEKDYVVILPMSSEEPDSSVIFAREDFRKISHISAKCAGTIFGFGLKGYELAVESFLI